VEPELGPGSRGPPSPPSRRRGGPARDSGARARPSAAHERFLRLDPDRAQREWDRYEGTPQRDLYRTLRERFLARHVGDVPWALDVGSGPGRFLPQLGAHGARLVALDLSETALRLGRRLLGRGRSVPAAQVERVRGDALRPPFVPRAFGVVAALGNALGFEERAGEGLLATLEGLVARPGRLMLEIAPGPGESSRYLARLPPGAVRRLLAAPVGVVVHRIQREGFRRMPVRHASRAFRRWTAEELVDHWKQDGWSVREVVAVAPALGPEVAALAEVKKDPTAWSRLLEVEEALGAEPSRWPDAAAVLLAVELGAR
jgi:SAM-dependent methyltransferase